MIHNVMETVENSADFNCLTTTHKEIANQWHDTLNTLTPEEVVPGSNKKVWWKCPVAKDHVWKCSVVDRVRRSTQCPFCRGKRGSSTSNLADSYPNLMKEWDFESNVISPFEITYGSSKKIWWKCVVNPNHKWQATVNNRTSKNHSCPYCSGKKADLSTSIFAKYPEICKEWDDEADYNLIMPNSHNKIKWKCKFGHRWKATPNNRTSSLSGCPQCKESGGEKFVSNVLLEMNVPFSKEFTFPDCKNARRLRFDFALHANKLGLIEFNGGQHYGPVELFGGDEEFEKLQANDKIKKDYCLKNHIPLLVISHNESKNVKSMLAEFVKMLNG